MDNDKGVIYNERNGGSHHSGVVKREGGGPYPKYITRDERSHNGGAWKGARTIKALLDKSTRAGTYDEQLRRIKQ